MRGRAGVSEKLYSGTFSRHNYKAAKLFKVAHLRCFMPLTSERPLCKALRISLADLLSKKNISHLPFSKGGGGIFPWEVKARLLHDERFLDLTIFLSYHIVG